MGSRRTRCIRLPGVVAQLTPPANAPRIEPIDDAQAYLQAVLQWHFGPDTGSRYWHKRAEALDFNPLTDVKTFEDLSLFPNIVDELRDVDVRDLVPAGYGPNPPIPAVYESGVLNDWMCSARRQRRYGATYRLTTRGRGRGRNPGIGAHRADSTRDKP